MMERKVCFLSILAAAAVFASCSDESYSSRASLQPCNNEGEVICSQTGGLLTCTDGFYSPSSCPENTTCMNGECVNSCNPEKFPMKCSDENSRLVCGSDGIIATEKCEEGNICHEGYCRYKELIKCDSSYEQQCLDDTTRAQCQVGYVVSHKCAEGQTCYEGICSSAEKCNEGSFDKSCKNVNTQFACVDGRKKEVNCPAGTMCVDGSCTSDCSGDIKICSADGMISYTCENGTLAPTICNASGICQDGECKDQVACTPAEFSAKCVDGKVVKCSSNGEIVEESCPAGLECFAGACVSDAPCDASEITPSCLNDSTILSCSDNGNKERISCEDGKTCENGICQVFDEACETGAKQCISASIARECIDGFWHSKYCDVALEVCSNDGCMNKSEATTCANGTPARCDQNTALICENGYLSKKACATGQHCESGVCYDDITVGGACDQTKFVQQCLDDGKLAVCENGVIVSTGCGEGICKAGACTGSSCVQENFTPECRGDFEITACENGLITKVSCGTNMHCSGNQCVPDAGEGDPCKPESFTASCKDGKRMTCEKGDSEDSTIHLTECDSSLPFCLKGACVACDPDNYGTTCTDGRKFTCNAEGALVDSLCPTDYVCFNNDCAQCDPNAAAKTCKDESTQHICNDRGNYEDVACPGGFTCETGECMNTCEKNEDCQKTDTHYFCEEGQCKFKADCALSDPSVCEDNKIRSCKNPGVFEYTECATGETCKLNGSNVPECFGSECDPETYGMQCSDDGKKIMVCEKGYLKEKTACTGNDVCKNGKCMGNECDPEKYAAQCDNNTPKYCDNGYIKTKTACVGVCIGGSCFDCDHEKTPISCKSENKYQVVCKDSNTYSVEPCDAGFECKEGKGCVSKCGEGFAESCNESGQRVWCDDGTIKSDSCDYRSECVGGKCVSREDKDCIPAIYDNKCHDNNGSPVLESCNPTLKKVKFSSCSTNGQFCGTVDGMTDCYSSCTAAQAEMKTTYCSTWNFVQSIGKCTAGKDYKNNPQYGITRHSAICERGNSISCRFSNHNSHLVFDYLPCEKMGNTCSGANGSCGFASCGTESASCSGTTAINCKTDPAVGGLVQTSMDCAAVGGSCVVINPDGIERALCNVEVKTNTSPATVSSLGTCSGNSLLTLYWPNDLKPNSYEWHSFDCQTACKTVSTTYNGQPVNYSYCE